MVRDGMRGRGKLGAGARGRGAGIGGGEAGEWRAVHLPRDGCVGRARMDGMRFGGSGMDGRARGDDATINNPTPSGADRGGTPPPTSHAEYQST